MKIKLYQLMLSVLCIWNYAQSATKSIIIDDISDVIDSCDYTRFDNQLENLKKGNSILEHKLEDIQKFLDKQMNQMNDLEQKLNSLPQQIEEMQENLIKNNKQNFKDLENFISKEIKNRNPIVYPVDDKIILINEMKGMLEKHDKILDEIIRNQNDSQVAMKEMVSEKLAIVSKMDAKLTNIQNNTIPRSLLTEVISNQNYIKKFLNEINFENNTQTLKDIISDKLAIVPQLDAKLTNLEGNMIPKAEEIKFYRDVQQYLNKTDSIKICLKDDNQNLKSTSQSYPTNCADLDPTHCTDNKCLIINRFYGPKPFFVSCNNSVEEGGWTVIQRRINGLVDFYRNWSEYKAGFGDINGEFFIGLDKLHALTSSLKPVELMIQLQDFNNTIKYAKYDDFQVGNEIENFKLLKVGSYTGTAGDSFSGNVDHNFSTKDRYNGIYRSNCAAIATGGWWFFGCGYSNLNGKYYHLPSELPKVKDKMNSIFWSDFHGFQYSMKFVEMMIRPKPL